MALPGTPGCQYTADGLTHTERGIPTSSAADHAAQLDKRRDKLARFLGLDWIYADDPRLLQPAILPNKPVSPGPSHIEELISLCDIGYVRGIEAKLAELGGLGDNRAFVDAARAYVQAFDLAGLRSFLTSFETGREPIHG